MSERFKIYPFVGILFATSVAGLMFQKTFEGPNIRHDFKRKIKTNPAVSIRINGLFFPDKDLVQQINTEKDFNIEPREIARNNGYFDGVIYFKNKDSATFKVFKSNSELKTYYFIDMKQDLTLTRIKTSKFDSIKIDSVQFQ